jgi:hypothetical protein
MHAINRERARSEAGGISMHEGKPASYPALSASSQVTLAQPTFAQIGDGSVGRQGDQTLAGSKICDAR